MKEKDYPQFLSQLIHSYKNNVDFLSIRLESSQGSNIKMRNGQIENISEGTSIGGQVRACHKGGWGFATFNDLTQIADCISDAISAAQLIGDDKTVLAEVEPVVTSCKLPLTGTNPRLIHLSQKKDLVGRCDRILNSYHQDITSTTVRYSDIQQKIVLATSEGSLIEQTWIDSEMRFSATAKRGELVQTGRETTGTRRGFEDLLNLDKQIESAAKRAVNALDLPTVKGGTYTVVIDPILAGLFVHEAFGHLSEADMAYENPDLLEVMTMGRKFGGEFLQIFDGAQPEGHRGSYYYDDEGVPATTTQLIKDGLLVGRLHSRETAGKLGEKPTGNARCLNYHYPPIVRMTNTWIGRGNTPVKDLFSNIKEGVYARNWLGGMTNGEMFTFTAGEAWMIRDGIIAEPVKNVTLSGNVFKTLANIEAIGDDFYWDESGGCGKGGQNGLAVGCGSPSLRIKDVVIGGEN